MIHSMKPRRMNPVSPQPPRTLRLLRVVSRDGWPLPPPIAPRWMARRAVFWLGLLRAGRVQRFHADYVALSGMVLGGGALARQRRPLMRYGDALRAEWRARAAAGPAGPALRRADHPNYLGSLGVVQGLVDGYVALLIARAGGAVPHEACEAEMRRLSAVFAGADPEYAAIGGWNTVEGLGASVVARCPLQAGPELGLPTLLAEMFALLGLLVFQVLRAAEEGGLSAEAALTRLRALAQRAGMILLGTADALPEGETLAALMVGVPGA